MTRNTTKVRNEADLARIKLDQLREEMGRYGINAQPVIKVLLDGITEDVGRLERKAYFIITKPRFLRKTA